MHAALAVRAGVDAAHVAARGLEDVALEGVVNLNPGEVVRAVLAVAGLGQLVDAALLDDFRRVEHRKAVAHVLAVRQDGVLNHGVGVARSGDDVDVFDVFERLQARAGAGAVVGADVQRGLAGELRLAVFGLLLADLVPVADVDHVGAGAAVVEEAVDGVG